MPADVIIKSRRFIGRHVSVKGVRENNAGIWMFSMEVLVVTFDCRSAR